MYRAISAAIRRRCVRTSISVSQPHDVSRYLVCLWLLVAASGAVSAQTSLPGGIEGQTAPPKLDLKNLSEETLQQLRDAERELLAKHQRDGRSASARGVIGGVTVAARCVESFVVNGSHRASASDVRIIAAEPRDCAGGRCRAYYVTAVRNGSEPFDLEVSVTCS